MLKFSLLNVLVSPRFEPAFLQNKQGMELLALGVPCDLIRVILNRYNNLSA